MSKRGNVGEHLVQTKPGCVEKRIINSVVRNEAVDHQNDNTLMSPLHPQHEDFMTLCVPGRRTGTPAERRIFKATTGEGLPIRKLAFRHSTICFSLPLVSWLSS